MNDVDLDLDLDLDLEDTPSMTARTLARTIEGLFAIMRDDEAVKNGNKRTINVKDRQKLREQARKVHAKLVEEI